MFTKKNDESLEIVTKKIQSYPAKSFIEHVFRIPSQHKILIIHIRNTSGCEIVGSVETLLI